MQGPAEVSTMSLVDATALYPKTLAGGAIPAQIEMAMQAEASRRQLDTIYLNIDAARKRLGTMDSKAKEAICEWKLPQRLRKFSAEHPGVMEDATVRELVVLEGKSNEGGGHGDAHQNPSARYISIYPLCILSEDAEVKEVESFAARFHDLEQEQNLLELLLVHETRNLTLAESQVASKPRLAMSKSPHRHKFFSSPKNGADWIENASTIQNDSEADLQDRRTPIKGHRGGNVPRSPWTKYLPAASAEGSAPPTATGGSGNRRKSADPALSDDERLCAYLELLQARSAAAEARARDLETELDASRRQTILAKEETDMATDQVRLHDEDRVRMREELRAQLALNEDMQDQLVAAAARRAAQELRALAQEESSRRQLLELDWRSSALDAYGRVQLVARRDADAREERSTHKYLAERAVAESSDLARAQADRERAVAVREAEQLRQQLADLESIRQEQAAAASKQADALQSQLHAALALSAKREEEAAELRRTTTELEIRLDIASSTSVSTKSVQRALYDQAARDSDSAVKVLHSTRYKTPVAVSIRSQLSERREADRHGDDVTVPRPRNVAPLPTSRDRGNYQ